jgi:hypothetical protein
MSTREKLIKGRLVMLALGDELQSISLACKRAGMDLPRFRGELTAVILNERRSGHLFQALRESVWVR